ncbi:flagellar biosynthesis anti-sigma factor FlgM [Parasphingorhabdus sp. DH2-15]|uniref:flagellar biosynthesis anti-sigma factor FlgM n=1 Tax=Parasphingorhabdus sp. DH2-15 TaxID=3444112 RepID=UPI003F68967A
MSPHNSFGSPIEGKDASRVNKPVSIKERQGLRAQQLAELGTHMDLIKITRIKKQLAEGEYNISPDLIALHLLDDSAGQ